MKYYSLFRSNIRHYLAKINILKRPSINYCIDNELLPSLFCQTHSNHLRMIFELPSSQHHTQLNQDIFALLINQFCDGFFLEIGANDGYTLSNTLYLEDMFGWKGILVEPNMKYMKSLSKRKNSKIVNKAVSSKSGSEEFIDAGLYGGLKSSIDSTHTSHLQNTKSITVECSSLQMILDTNQAPNTIDFISIDVEGGEIPIVEQMTSMRRRFKCGCIEHNHRIDDYNKIVYLLEKSDYRIIWKNQTKQDLFFIDNNKTI